MKMPVPVIPLRYLARTSAPAEAAVLWELQQAGAEVLVEVQAREPEPSDKRAVEPVVELLVGEQFVCRLIRMPFRIRCRKQRHPGFLFRN